jgi:two-component system response regulator FlrC
VTAAAAAVGSSVIAPAWAEPIAESSAMLEVLDAARDVAPAPTTVLLLGESGTGKELVARYIHALSQRSGPWVAVNCAALPSDLLESELFGHEKGSFTGASERRAGRFEQAHRGTLLLDEISELPLALQAKLLRVLQEREVDRVGGHRPVPVDVRVIATSNRDLTEMVRRGLFRSDLYYRLNVFPIVLPPLRDRPEDLPALAAHILTEAARALARPEPALDGSALSALAAQPFPGNVRELRNVLERALVRCRGPVLSAVHLRLAAPAPASRPHLHAAPSRPAGATGPDGHPGPFPANLPLDLSRLEHLAIAEALRRTGGNRTHAARLLGIGLRTLRNKLRAYRVEGVEVEAAEGAAGQEQPGGRPGDDEIRPSWSTGGRARSSQEEGP